MAELSQDVYNVPIADPAVTAGQKALVRGTITSVSGSGATAAITVTVDKTSSLGDTTTTVVVGPKQLSVVNII